MKDFNGREVRLGDRVKLWKDHYGRVVCAFDAEKFGHGYSKSHWGHLKTGVLVKMESGDLYYYNESDEDFEVVDNDQSPRPS
jgi:hypothetical protein